MSSNRGMQQLNDRVGQWEIHLAAMVAEITPGP
jgi:hypothetical protein